MMSKEEQVRAAIAEQAATWLVANDEGPLDARESAALAAWLKASPVHVEEFLRASVVARDLARCPLDSPEYSLAAVLASARAEEEPPIRFSLATFIYRRRRPSPAAGSPRQRHWQPSAVLSLRAILPVEGPPGPNRPQAPAHPW